MNKHHTITMPHQWNNLLVVTKDELVPKYYTCYSLYTTIQRYADKPYGIHRVRRACYNRPLLISFDSLPVEVQEAIGDPRKVSSILERYYQTDPEAVRFFATFKVGVKGRLSAQAQEEYIVNANVLLAMTRLKEARQADRTTKGLSLRGIMASLSSDVNLFNPVLRAKYGVAHTLPAKPDKLEKKYKAFIQGGYSTLISKRYNNSNAVKNTPQIQALLESLFTSQPHKPTATEVALQYEAFRQGQVEIIDNRTGEIYSPQHFQKLSQRSILAFLAAWQSKVATHKKRAGDRQKYMEAFTPYEEIEHVRFAGTIISVDDRQPPFNYAPHKRIWFYNAVDLGSECITAWVYGKSKENLIIDFYRQLVRNYAEWNLPLPYELECESSLNSSFRNTFLRDGALFKRVRIKANDARSKKVERYWGKLRYELEKKREGWIARPSARSEANQAGPQKPLLIPYPELVANCLTDLQTWNNMPHSIHKEKTRWEVFLQHQNPDNTNTINYPAILPHLGYKTTSSCKKGQIKLNNQICLLGDEGEIYTGDKLIQLMTQVEGKELDLYWLDNNDGNLLSAIICLRGTDRYIGQALPKPVTSRSELEQTPQQQLNRVLLERYRSTVDGYATRRKNAIVSVTVIDSRPLTLNNAFKIRELEHIRTHTPPTDDAPAPLLPSPEEALEMDYPTCDPTAAPSFRKSLKERY